MNNKYFGSISIRLFINQQYKINTKLRYNLYLMLQKYIYIYIYNLQNISIKLK